MTKKYIFYGFVACLSLNWSCAATMPQAMPTLTALSTADHEDIEEIDLTHQETKQGLDHQEHVWLEQENFFAQLDSSHSQPVYFDFDSDVLTEQSQKHLQAIAKILSQHKDMALTVEGHCDERGTAEYNLALGERRARSAKRFISRLGIPAHRIRVVSYGSERPAVYGRNEIAWGKNRRDELLFAQDDKAVSQRSEP